jgi:hypothetical protein
MTIDMLEDAVDQNGVPLSESRSNFVLSQTDILESVFAGMAQFQWVKLKSAPGLLVMDDALKIAGVRVPVSARTVEGIAKLLSAMPTTALVEDMIWNDADVLVEAPYIDPPSLMMSNRSVLKFNNAIDLAQRSKTYGQGALFASSGKSWVLSNAIDSRPPGTTTNYGFHRFRRPAKNHTSVDGKSYVIQTPGTAHNADHWDYSQTCRLCKWEDGRDALPPSIEPLHHSTLFV